MKLAKLTNTRGFSLLEVSMAFAILALLSGVVISTGVMLMRKARYNMVSAEARNLGIQKLEEIAAGGFNNIVLQTPFAPQTNLIQNVDPVVIRTVDVIGHATNLVEVADLMTASYLEIHVNVEFQSPVSKRRLTNTFSTIVSK
ncbi:MAG: hypothetical protein PCFJNLEI_00010 [Verrucomicrobiae bacterium]|nr:hypothetical protein [Verrucomicrobiae bacterium]